MKFANLCFAGALFFGATWLVAAGHDPAFGTGDFEGTITMASSGALCGGVTLAPELGQDIAAGSAVKLVSYRIHKVNSLVTREPRRMPGVTRSVSTSSGREGRQRSWQDKWTRIGEMTIREPVRVRYDWAGIFQSDRYAIQCYLVGDGVNAKEYEVPCSDVVKILDVRHDKGCVIGPAGPEAEYGTLGMNQSMALY